MPVIQRDDGHLFFKLWSQVAFYLLIGQEVVRFQSETLTKTLTCSSLDLKQRLIRFQSIKNIGEK